MPVASAVLVAAPIRLAVPVVVLPGERPQLVVLAALRLVSAVPVVVVPIRLLPAVLEQALVVLVELVHPVPEAPVGLRQEVLGVLGRAIPVVVVVAVALAIPPVLAVPVTTSLLAALTLAVLVLVLVGAVVGLVVRLRQGPLPMLMAPADFLAAVAGAPERREQRQRQ
jgi:hypothetical protein